MSNLGTHLLEGKIWNRICFIQIDRHYRIASVVLNWGRVYNLFGRLRLGNAMGKIEETYCGKSDAAPLLWLAPIDWKQRSKIQKLWRFRVSDFNSDWWIDWPVMVDNLSGICALRLATWSANCMIQVRKKLWFLPHFNLEHFWRSRRGQNLVFESCQFGWKWFELTSCCRWLLWRCCWGCCCCCGWWLEGVLGRFSCKRIHASHFLSLRKVVPCHSSVDLLWKRNAVRIETWAGCLVEPPWPICPPHPPAPHTPVQAQIYHQVHRVNLVNLIIYTSGTTSSTSGA